MDELRTIRDQAEAQYRAETQLRQTMTISESLHIWVKLQDAYSWQLNQTVNLFGQDHYESLITLQSRLHKLIE